MKSPEDATIVDAVHRLVVFDRRRRLGHAADAHTKSFPPVLATWHGTAVR